MVSGTFLLMACLLVHRPRPNDEPARQMGLQAIFSLPSRERIAYWVLARQGFSIL